MVKIKKHESYENPNYIGWDEDHNGDCDIWFMCPKCKENNYITINDKECDICGEPLEWVD